MNTNSLSPPIEDIVQLIQGCRHNEAASQERLYRYCYPLLINTCLRYAGDMDGAGIIFNNAMLRVFRYLSRYRHDNKWLPWIRTIVINCSIDYVKQRHRFADKSLAVVSEERFVLPEEVLQRIAAKDIRSLIWQMPRGTATVFNLFIYEGYTHREIGELLRISEGTSKWHMNEARRILKSKLEKFLND